MIRCDSHACATCPYRRDVPTGLWHDNEYEKLRAYDLPTGEQPASLFLCHCGDGTLCAGWWAVHGGELLAVRLGQITGAVGRLPIVCGDFYASGNEAADAGQRDIQSPSEAAIRAINRLNKRR